MIIWSCIVKDEVGIFGGLGEVVGIDESKLRKMI
jgi:hypothetical protein